MSPELWINPTNEYIGGVRIGDRVNSQHVHILQRNLEIFVSIGMPNPWIPVGTLEIQGGVRALHGLPNLGTGSNVGFRLVNSDIALLTCSIREKWMRGFFFNLFSLF